MIDELRVFIKKVLSEPTIAVKSMEIARKYRNEPNANEIIAREISANTTIRIPESWSKCGEAIGPALRMTSRFALRLCCSPPRVNSTPVARLPSSRMRWLRAPVNTCRLGRDRAGFR